MTPNKTVVRCVELLTFAAMAAAACIGLVAGEAQGKGAPSQPEGTEKQQLLEEHLWRQMASDQRRLTVRQVNLFHYHFIDRCVLDVLPPDVLCQYAGLLCTDSGGRSGQRVKDSLGWPLAWSVYKEGGRVIFTVGITTKPTPKTAAKCCIEGTEVYVNVLHIDGNRGLEEGLAELGGRSVREVLSRIDKLTVPQPDACGDAK